MAVSWIQTTNPKDILPNCYVVSTMQLFKHRVRWTKEAYFRGSHIWARDNPRRVNCSVSSCVVIVMNTVVDHFLLKGCLLIDIFNFLQDVLLVLPEAVSLAVRNSLWCQRDGAPADYRLLTFFGSGWTREIISRLHGPSGYICDTLRYFRSMCSSKTNRLRKRCIHF